MPRTITPWKGPLPSQEEWEKLGKPSMWVIQDTLLNYKLYQDYASGRLALTGPRRGIIDSGMGFVTNIDHTIVGLGPYYLADKCRLFCSSDLFTNEIEKRNPK